MGRVKESCCLVDGREGTGFLKDVEKGQVAVGGREITGFLTELGDVSKFLLVGEEAKKSER